MIIAMILIITSTVFSNENSKYYIEKGIKTTIAGYLIPTAAFMEIYSRAKAYDYYFEIKENIINDILAIKESSTNIKSNVDVINENMKTLQNNISEMKKNFRKMLAITIAVSCITGTIILVVISLLVLYVINNLQVKIN